MKTLVILTALLAASLPAFASDVGVSITVGQPGFYGRIDIGDYPQPVLIYPRPVVVQPVPDVVVGEPIYLRVPPGHARHWRKHCHEYGACGRPVYFVQDRWYNEVYVPRYRERHGDRDDWGDRHHGRHDGGERHGRGHDRD